MAPSIQSKNTPNDEHTRRMPLIINDFVYSVVNWGDSSRKKAHGSLLIKNTKLASWQIIAWDLDCALAHKVSGATIAICIDQCLIKSFTVCSVVIKCFAVFKSAARYNWMIEFGNRISKGGRESSEEEEDETLLLVSMNFAFHFNSLLVFVASRLFKWIYARRVQYGECIKIYLMYEPSECAWNIKSWTESLQATTLRQNSLLGIVSRLQEASAKKEKPSVVCLFCTCVWSHGIIDDGNEKDHIKMTLEWAAHRVRMPLVYRLVNKWNRMCQKFGLFFTTTNCIPFRVVRRFSRLIRSQKKNNNTLIMKR